jgi:hypothetical protein
MRAATALAYEKKAILCCGDSHRVANDGRQSSASGSSETRGAGFRRQSLRGCRNDLLLSLPVGCTPRLTRVSRAIFVRQDEEAPRLYGVLRAPARTALGGLDECHMSPM